MTKSNKQWVKKTNTGFGIINKILQIGKINLITQNCEKWHCKPYRSADKSNADKASLIIIWVDEKTHDKNDEKQLNEVSRYWKKFIRHKN